MIGALAWPALCENFLSTLVQFVDTAMVGALGAMATAAVAVNATPMWLFNGLVTAMSVGGTALVARMIGSKDQARAEQTMQQIFLGILLLSTVLCIIVQLLASYIPVWMRADPVIHRDATAYMRIVALGFIPHFTGVALGAALRGAGDTRTPMRIALGANLLNVLGNFFLIFPSRQLAIGGLSLPIWGADMGIRGAALSTAISTALAGIVMVCAVCRKKSRVRLRLRALRPNRDILRRILRIGLPAAVERVTINIGQLLFVGMVAALGTAQLAAHHLGITVESLSYMAGFAFGIAATTLVGQTLGAQRPAVAKRQGGLAIGVGVAVMSAIGVLLYVFAPFLISILTPDPQVREIGAMLIRICAFEQPAMALSMICSAALRGAGDTRAPLAASLIGMWGIRLVLAWLFVTQLGLGVAGAWYAMVVDVTIRGILMLVRFCKGKWIYSRV